MALSGAQLGSVLSKVGARGGQVASLDQLAAGANDALGRLKRAGGGKLNVDQAAAFLATCTMEGAYLRTTTEYGSGQRYEPYVGRTFEQLTWRENYAAFGRWCRSLGLVTDPDIFVKNPPALSSLTWAWLGGVYYWTAPRSWGAYGSTLLEVAENGNILAVSRAVNAGTPSWTGTPGGMDVRRALFEAFRALGSSILPGTSGGSTTTPSRPSTPAGAIPGTAAMVLKAANALWNQYKGKLYTYGWPGLRTLGDRPSSEYWCADFVRLAIRQGSGYDWKNYTAGKSGPAYCPALVSGMVRDPYWTEVKYAQAKPGDVVFFFRGSLSYHVGLVEVSPTAGGHDMRTIEGNTSTPGMSTSMSAGGTLAKKTRDDRYYTMRIFRPTYWAETQVKDDAGNDTTDTPDTDVITVEERPSATSAGYIEPPTMQVNPIDQLQPSEAFWAASRESSARVNRASLWLDGAEVIADLPVDYSQSKISVDGSQPVRRKASLKLILDEYDGRSGDLEQALCQPGMKLRIESGFGYGGGEMVPVFEGMWDDPHFDRGTVSIDSPDCMARIALAGFPTTVCSSTDMTYVDHIRFFVSEIDDGAAVIDLTGNVEKVPYVIWDAGPQARINAVMSMAAAIGAELFKSPAAGYYVLRPIVSPREQVGRWVVDEGDALVSLSKSVKWSSVRNGMIVTCDRNDAPRMVGEWRDTDPDSPTRWDGPFGRRPGFLSTSLLPPDRDVLEDAAESLAQRLIGGRIDVEWVQLINLLQEAGDPIDVSARGRTYSAVLDSFEIPLGSQRVTPGKARSLNIEGLT